MLLYANLGIDFDNIGSENYSNFKFMAGFGISTFEF
jgi:hypothetical protein